MTAGVMRRKLGDIRARVECKIVPNPRRNERLLETRDLSNLLVKLNQRRMIVFEVNTDLGIDATRLAAGAFDRLIAAMHPVHVGGRSAKVADDLRARCDLSFHFPQY